MNVHEFQAKRILQNYGVPVPEFFVVSSLEELSNHLQVNKWSSAVLKVQVHAGGRGKAGGVKIARNPQDILHAAEELLGKRIITPQTGPEGLVAHQLLVSLPVSIVHEYYLSLTVDRERAQVVLIASADGGIEVEQISHKRPESVLVLPLPPEGAFRSYQFIRLAKFMGWQGSIVQQGIQVVNALVRAFKETDALLLEINPLVETQEGNLKALDAKLVLDDNALYRQPQLKALFEAVSPNPQEVLAQQHHLAYVALDGNIGCMVNGAGLAMATLDLIHHYGGRSANFLDIGGGASKEKVEKGFKIILSDPKVKVVLVNIFGGIMDCEIVAEGVAAAAKELHMRVPMVVRLEGTNAERGRALLNQSDLNILSASDFAGAVRQVVEMAKK